MGIREQLENIEALRNAYEYECVNISKNSDKAIFDFHRWYIAAVEFFCEILGEDDQLLQKFRAVDVSGNGFVLYDVYHSLLNDYVSLKFRVKKYDKIGSVTGVMPEERNHPRKIFISHSFQDKDFAEALVNLLLSLGFSKQDIFCSSIPGCWIGINKYFLKEIKTHFIKYDLYVIFIHSPRFYESYISLNEMGAAWALQKEYCSFLTKDMEYSMMKAVVTNQQIAIKVNADDVEFRLDDWRKLILEWFGKSDIESKVWKSCRYKFLRKVSPEKLDPYALTQEDNEWLKKWVMSKERKLNVVGHRIWFGPNDYHLKLSEERKKVKDFLERLRRQGLITQKGGRNFYECELTEMADSYISKI